jgi:hypothetical protein
MTSAGDPSPRPHQPLGWLSLPQMRYSSAYAWLVLVSSLDIILTSVILRLGGREVNPIAEAVIAMHGLPGMIAFKFALMVFVIIMCEVIGRVRPRTGLWLARFGILASAFPVIVGAGVLRSALGMMTSEPI